MGWSSSREHQGTVPVNRPVTQYNHKSESLMLSAGWPARGFIELYFKIINIHLAGGHQAGSTKGRCQLTDL